MLSRALPTAVFFAFFVACVLLGRPAFVASAPAGPHPAVCGPLDGGGPLREPPDVEMWTQPRNAAGVPELILAVHRQGDLFCYRYTVDGVPQRIPPTIRVRRGEQFAIRIVNDIRSRSKGESVSSADVPPCMPMPMPATAESAVRQKVGYLNHAIDDRYFKMKPVDTNLHLHGFQGPAREEDIFLSTLSTPMHACEYTIAIPRSQPPGTYFYHPHSHGASELQVIGGLAGTWIVEPDSPQIARADEHVLVVRYRIPFAPDNPFAPDFDAAAGQAAEAHQKELDETHPSPVPYDPFDPPAWPLTVPVRLGHNVLFDGCNGSDSDVLMSIDGSDAPASLDVPAGRTQLLRVVNATSDDPLLIDLHGSNGSPQPMHVVGLDGTPVGGDDAHPLGRYLTLDRLMLPPAGRADLLVRVPSGDVTLSSEHFCEGVFYQMHHELLRVRAVEGGKEASDSIVSAPADVAETPAAKLVAFARANPSQIRRRALAYTAYVFPKDGKIPAHQAYFITDITNANFHEHPFWPAYSPGATVPSNPDVVVKRGTIEEWYLISTTPEVHTFHIHQMSFVLERGDGGVPMTRDAVVLPIGHLEPNAHDPEFPLMRPSVTKILLDFRKVPKGTFVFHCHMLFHEDRGMMGTIRVE
jgi:FtsP/CotA-like multicopper oxidase with cupredoxin domain